MPSQSSRHTVARQWELLRCLPATGSGSTVSGLRLQLAELGFPVSKRQVERDLKDLAVIFPLECNDAGTPHGWRWRTGAHVDLPGMDVTQALSLRLVEGLVRPLLPASLLDQMDERFELAKRKLADLGDGNALCRWQDKVCSLPAQLNLQPPMVDEVVLSVVHQTLLADEQIEVDYRPMDADRITTLRLHPLALIQRGPISYVAATAWDYQDIRQYALHRMSAARRTYEASSRPFDFSLEQWLSEGSAIFGRGNTIRLQARVSESLARILNETPLASGQRLCECRLDVSLKDSWELRWWILSQAQDIEVLSPKALRRDTAEALKAAASQYSD